MLYFIAVSLFCWYRVWFCERLSQLPMIGTHGRGVIGVTIRWFSASRFSGVLFHKTHTVSQRATSSSYIAVSPWIMSLSSIMMLLSLIGIEFGVVMLPNLAHIAAVIGVTIGLIFAGSQDSNGCHNFLLCCCLSMGNVIATCDENETLLSQVWI